MSNWDEEDYEPEISSGPKASDKWEGEDEEEDIKDAWDDEDEDGEKKPEGAEVVQRKKKKSLKEIIAEKEAKKRQEVEERKKMEEEAKRKLTPEEIMAEKLRQQKLQEDSDLELAKSAFGTSNDTLAGRTGALDTYEPVTKEDFDNYCRMVKDKFTSFEKSTNYIGFLEMLYRELAVSLETDEVKRLSSCLTALYNEKNKAAKAAKGKKKGKGKVSINAGKDDNYDDYTTGAYDDYDDFM